MRVFGERIAGLEEDEIEQAVEMMEMQNFLENAERGSDDEEVGEEEDGEEEDEEEEENDDDEEEEG